MLSLRLSLILATALVLCATGGEAEDKSKVEVVPTIGHSASVFSVAFSPDASLLLSGSQDATLKLWNAATGHLIRTFESHSDGVTSVAFSPDGEKLLSGSWDRTLNLKLWDAATGRVLRTFKGHSDNISPNAVAFSPDGTQVLSGSEDKTLKFWETASGRLIRTLKGHSGDVTSVAFSPDGKQQLSGGADGLLKLWDARTGRALRTFKGHSASVGSVAFSPDGTQVLSGSWDKTLKLWDTASGRLVRTFEGHTDAARAVAFAPDGTKVLSGGWDNTLKLWETASGRLIRTFEGHSSGVTSVAFSRDGSQILSGGGSDYTLKLWEVSTGRLIRTISGYEGSGNESGTFSPDGTQVLSARHYMLTLWDAITGKLLHTFMGDSASDWFSSVAFSPNGSQALSAGSKVQLWDAAGGKLIRDFEGSDQQAKVSNQCLAQQDEMNAWRRDMKLTPFTAEESKELCSGELHVRPVAFSPDGKQVLSGGKQVFSGGSRTQLWDTASGRLIQTFVAEGNGVEFPEAASVAFSPDGTHVLAGGPYWLQLWDAASGHLVRSFEGPVAPNQVISAPDQVQSVAFSPDGTQALSGEWDHTLKLWEVASGKLLRTFVGHSNQVNSVAFSPNGTQVLSGSDDRTLRLWELSSGRLIRRFQVYAAVPSAVGAYSSFPSSGSVSSVAFSPKGDRVLSAIFDGTTRLWKTETGELLATMTVSPSGEWITLTPAGFFTGSPKGSELISVVRGLKVYSAMQFFDALYRPDLVEEALKGDPNGRYKNAAAELNLEKILDSGDLPEIQLLDKEAQQAEGAGKVSLSVNIKSGGGGIGEKLIWRVNGVTQGNPTPPELKGLANDPFANATVTETLTVDPGQPNIVEVTAYNGAGLLATLPLRITVDKFGATTAERPRMHVLAIGVNKYRMPAYQLNYAVNDANEFTKAMTKVGSELFAGVDVTTLEEEKVTRDDIAAAFNQISAVTKPGDVFVLFLSGHGVSVDGRYYYYPQNLDFAAGQTYQNGIGQDLWQEWLAKIPAQKTLLILDTCESGGASGLIKGASARETAMDQLQYATGQNLIAAAGSSEVAREGYKNHGVLTYALLEALSQQPAVGGEKRVKVGMLADYIEERVPDITKSVWGIPQRPMRKLSGNDFPIGFRTAGLLDGGEDIPNEPTHVLIRSETVREMPAPDAPGGLTLDAGTQVRVVDWTGDFAKIARAGKKLGYVPKEALLAVH